VAEKEDSSREIGDRFEKVGSGKLSRVHESEDGDIRLLVVIHMQAIGSAR
jgi:hypothetical protein